MAGTFRPKLGKLAPPGPLRRGPAVVLVRPQLGENIGAAARAMLNCGLTEMRLVAPRDGWPNPSAYVLASKADPVLDAASVFATTQEAVADMHRVYATTARARDMLKPVLTPRQAAAAMHEDIAAGKRVSILFGPERTGLENDEVALADIAISVPLNPGFSSLNLAQAVLLIGYEWFTAEVGTELPALEAEWASQQDIEGLHGQFASELEAAGFFHNIEPKRESVLRNLRAMLQRIPLSAQEVRTLRGMIKALAIGRPLRAPYSKRRQQAERADDDTGGSNPAG
ncbi:RNA methyltransferase [Ferrovibrio sp.]|uniref:RNA methyltransferase n=1 Tax=Ferrovibrio sp. TaxID=1917215 RepID=UPI0025C3925E|nr:RNA methyltransferase [Ferrovibrio sp.]MBX3455002.1 RNA methyltransferase [Ferrovibrio sp.]